MNYKVTKQYLRGSEITFAEFSELGDAKLFIAARMENDVSLNIKVTYRILELGETIAEFKPGSDIQQDSPHGQQQSASFRPTPLSTTPRPSGTPPKWLKDDEEEEK